MRKVILSMLAALGFVLGVVAQDRTITGRVMNDKGAPIEGVSITSIDIRNGAQTDKDGNYSISVSGKAKSLTFSSVGYETQKVSIKGTTVNAVLLAFDRKLDEVVVVGYGTQKRKEVTGSLSTVKGQAIADKPVQSFDQALAGRSAGVQITVPSGVLNSPPVFRIRGTNSISLSSYPLIIVDGIPSPTGDFSGTNAAGNALASINPNDIESIDIAKDAAATAIYGSRAANGVVFITTKKGKGRKARISYNGGFGYTSAYGIPAVLNAQQYTDYKNGAAANNQNLNTTNPSGAGYTKFALANDNQGQVINTNWADVVYRKGFSQDHNINISGASENTSYYFSGGFSNQEGILKRNDFVRKNILMNIENRVNTKITLGGKVSYSNEQNLSAASSGSLSGEAFNTGGFGRAVLVNAPSVGIYKNDGTYNIASNNVIGSMGNSLAQVGFYNPQVAIDLNRSNSETDHIQSNIYLQFKPTSWLTLKTLYGIDYLLVDNEIYQTPIHGDGVTTNGNAFSFFSKNKRYTWNNTAQIDYSFAKAHNVSLLVGTEQDRRTTKGYGINRQQVSDPVYTVIQAGWGINNPTGASLGENYLQSVFGRFNYDYKKRYFLSTNLRQDEYSALPGQKEVFYGISGAWDVSNEKFWKGNIKKVISSLKIHASNGKVGNTGGIGDFGSYSTFGSGIYGNNPSLIFNQAGNPNLKWETSIKSDYGVNIGLLKDRLSVDFTYYNNNISNLILNVPQSPSAGLPTTVPSNIGTMYNRGIELTLNGVPVRTKDFVWTSNFNLSKNKNEVTSLAPGLNEVLVSTSGLETVSRTAPGFPQGTLWVVRSAGVDPATGSRIFLNQAGQKVLYRHVPAAGQFQWSNPDGTRYLKADGSPNTINQAADGVMFGNVNPKYVGGFSNNFKYKGFDLDVLLTYQFDFYVYYGTHAGLFDQRFWNNSIEVLDAWKKPGDITDIPRAVFSDNVSNGSGLPSSFNVFKGDFVKLKSLTLGYNISSDLLSKANISNARFYISGQNLAIFTKYPGPDPEVSSNGNSNGGQGIDRNTIANGRTISFGVNLSF
jgi:TonB-dependent starch-binding outer membrane protein SusC